MIAFHLPRNTVVYFCCLVSPRVAFPPPSSLLFFPPFSFLSLHSPFSLPHRGNARPHLMRPPLHPPPVLILRKTAHFPRKSQSSQPRKLLPALELAQRLFFLMEQHPADYQVERVPVVPKWALSSSQNHRLLIRLVSLGPALWCPQLLKRLER